MERKKEIEKQREKEKYRRGNSSRERKMEMVRLK